MFTAHQYESAIQAVRDEIAAKFPDTVQQAVLGALVLRSEQFTVEQGCALREYMRCRTNLESDPTALTADQAAWRSYYYAPTDQICHLAPDVLREIERIEHRAALARVRAEIQTKIDERPEMTVQETQQLRQYAKSKSGLHRADLSPDQAAWKTMYEALTNRMRELQPDLMAKLEPLEKNIDTAELLKAELQAFADSPRHEKGFKVPFGFLVVGLLVGLLRSPSVESVLVFGLAGGLSGLVVSIFVLNSPTVQIDLGLRLKNLGLERIGGSLNHRGMTALFAWNRRHRRGITDMPGFWGRQ